MLSITEVLIILLLALNKSVGQDYEEGGGESPVGLPDEIKIAGLFDEADPNEETAFKHALERVNADSSILPNNRLSAQIEQLTPGDSFKAATKVCEMLSQGIAAIFGPQSAAASHVQSVCDAFEIPHIEIKWDYSIRKEDYLINLSPHPNTLSKAYNDIIESFGWTEYVVIYDSSDKLYTLQEIFKASIPPERNILVKQLPEGDNYRPILRQLLHSINIFNIVVHCDTEKVTEVLKQAQQVGLMNYKYSYFITSLDLHTLNLDDFAHSDMNITAFRLVDPDKPEVKAIVQGYNEMLSGSSSDVEVYSRNAVYGPQVKSFYRRGLKNRKKLAFSADFEYDEDEVEFTEGEEVEEPEEEAPPEDPKMITTQQALIYDAVSLFAKALHELDSTQTVEINPIDCDSKGTWRHGYSIINYMKTASMPGITGMIQFNTLGYRSDVQLDVIQLQTNGLKKIGLWDAKFVTKTIWEKGEQVEAPPVEIGVDLKNKTLIITSIMNNPFLMLTLSKTPLQGNAQFEGFTVDLLEELSQLLGFHYIIKVVADGSYGSLNRKTGLWNGMIREVMDEEADVAVADLSINDARLKALDFTMPFMNLGISILFVEPSNKAPELFSFMKPFTADVWINMSCAIVVVSFIIFLTGRLSPYEWESPHPCIYDPDELENQYTLLNSFWFTSGALLGGGSDVAPKCASTRILAAIWWFFTLIIVSSYTANLASFLIAQEKDEPIKNLEDLYNQDVIQYGCVGSGSTAMFFRESKMPWRREMWNRMVEWNAKTPGVLPSNNGAGVDRVLGNPKLYAFFMESTVIEYNTERRCGLTQVGGLLDSKGYGIGMRKGSPYRQPLNGGILILQETGVLDKLKRKWWQEERKSPGCPGSDDSMALGLPHVGGCFVVLVGGCILAIFICFIEFVWECWNVAKEKDEKILDRMVKELILAFSGTSKPIEKEEEKKDGSVSSKESDDGDEEAEKEKGSSESLELDPGTYGFVLPPQPIDGDMHREYVPRA